MFPQAVAGIFEDENQVLAGIVVNPAVLVNLQVWQARGRYQGEQGICDCKQVNVGMGSGEGMD